MNGKMGVLGLGINLDLSQFESSLTKLRRGMRVVDSEMKANSTAFGLLEKSAESYGKTINSLNDKYKLQSAIVDEYRKKYEELTNEFGESSKASQDALVKYNRQVASLNKLGTQVEKTKSDFAEFNEEKEKIGKEMKIDDLQRSIRLIESEMEATASAVGDTEKSLDSLGDELEGLTKIYDAQSKVVDEFEKEYNHLVETQGEGSKAAQEAKIAYNEQLVELNKLGDQVVDATTEFENFNEEKERVAREMNIDSLQRSMREIETGMDASSSAMGNAEKSADSLGEEIEGLGKLYDLQSKIVEEYDAEYRELVETQGEGSKAAQEAKIKLNEQTTELNKLGSQISDTERELESFNSEMSELGTQKSVRVAGLESLSSMLGEAERQADKLGQTLQNIGGGLQSVGGNLTKYITAPIVGATTAAGGLTAALGWGRLTGLDNAKAQLEGLGYTAKEVEGITDEVSEAVQGGMMTVAEGTSAAAGGMAAGVERGKELEKYLKLIDAAAVGANRPVNEMAQIFSRVQGQGKLMTEELNRVEDGMPGFSKAMAEHMGVSLEEFRKMVTEGQVSSEDFMTVMETHAGGMAEAFSGTMEGMISNTKANIGIIGELMLGGVFEKSKESISEFLDLLRSDDLREWAEDVGVVLEDTFGKVIDKVKEVIDWFKELDSEGKKKVGVFAVIAAAAGPVIGILGTITIFIGGVVRALAPLFGGLKKVVDRFKDVDKGGNKTSNMFKKVGGALRIFTGPVGLIVGALVGLGAAFVVAYSKSEEFRDTLKNVWDLISSTFEDVVGMFSTFKDDFEEVLGTITGFWKGFISLIRGDTEEGTDLLVSLGFDEEKIEKFTAGIDKVREKFTGFFDTINGYIDDARVWKDAIVQAFHGATGETETLLQGLGLEDDEIQKVIDTVDSVKEGIQNAFDIAKDVVKIAGDAILDVSGRLLEMWDKYGPKLEELGNRFLKVGWDAIKQVVVSLFEIFKDLFDSVVRFFNEDGDKVESGVEGIIDVFFKLYETFMEDLLPRIERFIEILEVVLPIAIGIAMGVIKVLVGTLKLVVGAVIGIVEAFNYVFGGGLTEDLVAFKDSIVENVGGAFTWIKEEGTQKLQEIWESITGFFTRIGESISGAYEGAKTGVTDFFVGIYDEVTGFFGRIFEKVTGFVGDILTEVREFFSPITEIFNTFKEVFIGTIGSFFGYIVEVFVTFTSLIIGKLVEVIGNIVKKIGAFYLNIIKNLVGFVTDVYGKFVEVRDKVVGVVTDFALKVWSKFVEVRDKVVGVVTDFALKVWNRFVEVRDKVVGVIVDLATKVWNKFTEMRDKVLEVVGNLIEPLVSKFVSIRDRVVGVVSGLYTGVRDKFNDVKDKVTEIIENMKKSVTDKFDDIVSSASKLPERIGDGIKKKVSFITDAIREIGNAMAKKLGEVVNGITNGMNTVLGKLGIEDKLPKWEVPKYSTGTKGHPGGLMTVADHGVGNKGLGMKRELVKFPNGQTQIFNKETTMYAPKGTEVFSNRDTEKIISGLQQPIKYAGGTGGSVFNFGKELLSKIKSGVADVWDVISNPSKLVENLVNTFSGSLTGLTQMPLKMAKGAVNTLKNAAVGFMTKKKEEATPKADISSLLGGHTINYHYGKYPFDFNGGNHYGVDTSHVYDAVHAPIGGKVLRNFWDTGGGQSIEVQSGKVFQWFMHLSKSLVKAGDTIRTGQKIAISGNTGANTTGPHLHYQLFRNLSNPNGSSFNPLPYLRGRGKGDGGGANKFGFYTGGLIRDRGYYELGERGEEAVIPLNDYDYATKMLAYVNEKINNKGNNNKRPNDIPDYRDKGGSSSDSKLVEMFTAVVEAKDKEVELLKMAIKEQMETNELLKKLYYKETKVDLDGRRVSKELKPHLDREEERRSNRSRRYE